MWVLFSPSVNLLSAFLGRVSTATLTLVSSLHSPLSVDISRGTTALILLVSIFIPRRSFSSTPPFSRMKYQAAAIAFAQVASAQ